MESAVSSKELWQSIWSSYRPEIYQGPIYEFAELYKKHLPVNSSLSFLEIGAMPGHHLVYFSKEFGYKVTGIDYLDDVSPIYETLKINNVQNYEVIRGDVFNFLPEKGYDVVFSSGFVEHFEDYEEVIRTHSNLVREEGYLLITVPNVTGIHAILMSAFDKELFATHRPYLMKKKVLSELVTNQGFDVLFCDYLRTFRPFYPLPNWAQFISRCICKLLSILKLEKIPNEFASPYLYMIAKRASK